MFDLTGKTALVTGATGGIGGEIAKALHAAGATVVLSGTREAVLQDLAQQLGEGRAPALALPSTVTDEGPASTLEGLFEQDIAALLKAAAPR